MLRSMGTPIYLIAGWLLLILCGVALADETLDEYQEPETADAYDRALVKFNNNIKSYDSFEAFRTDILNKVPLGTPGKCYELTGAIWNPIEITRVAFDGLDDEGWRQTSGRGWRMEGEGRQFKEYRVNIKANLLSRVDGVKPRMFFGGRNRICEFQW